MDEFSQAMTHHYTTHTVDCGLELDLICVLCSLCELDRRGFQHSAAGGKRKYNWTLRSYRNAQLGGSCDFVPAFIRLGVSPLLKPSPNKIWCPPLTGFRSRGDGFSGVVDELFIKAA